MNTFRVLAAALLAAGAATPALSMDAPDIEALAERARQAHESFQAAMTLSVSSASFESMPSQGNPIEPHPEVVALLRGPGEARVLKKDVRGDWEERIYRDGEWFRRTLGSDGTARYWPSGIVRTLHWDPAAYTSLAMLQFEDASDAAVEVLEDGRLRLTWTDGESTSWATYAVRNGHPLLLSAGHEGGHRVEEHFSGHFAFAGGFLPTEAVRTTTRLEDGSVAERIAFVDAAVEALDEAAWTRLNEAGRDEFWERVESLGE